MITESKVTENFCIADDFCKEFEIEMAKNALASTSISSAISSIAISDASANTGGIYSRRLSHTAALWS